MAAAMGGPGDILDEFDDDELKRSIEQADRSGAWRDPAAKFLDPKLEALARQLANPPTANYTERRLAELRRRMAEKAAPAKDAFAAAAPAAAPSSAVPALPGAPGPAKPADAVGSDLRAGPAKPPHAFGGDAPGTPVRTAHAFGGDAPGTPVRTAHPFGGDVPGTPVRTPHPFGGDVPGTPAGPRLGFPADPALARDLAPIPPPPKVTSPLAEEFVPPARGMPPADPSPSPTVASPANPPAPSETPVVASVPPPPFAGYWRSIGTAALVFVTAAAVQGAMTGFSLELGLRTAAATIAAGCMWEVMRVGRFGAAITGPCVHVVAFVGTGGVTDGAELFASFLGMLLVLLGSAGVGVMRENDEVDASRRAVALPPGNGPQR